MRFFFYGTLRSGHAPPPIAHALRDARLIGAGRVPGRLYDLGAYPGGILDEQAATAIPGDVFELPDDPAVLRDLDAYEDFDPQHPAGSLFVRREVDVRLDDGRRLSCWMYEYNGDLRGRLPMTGDQGWTRATLANDPEPRDAEHPL